MNGKQLATTAAVALGVLFVHEFLATNFGVSVQRLVPVIR